MDHEMNRTATVREMHPDEKPLVSRLMRRSFNWFTWLFFDFGTQAYVYERDGEIVAGITLKTFRIGHDRRGGIVKWLFTAPDARGTGAAGRLVDAALEWLDARNCSDVFACVEGYNTGSSNVFARRGFALMPFRRQLLYYRFTLPRVWFGTFHLFDVGHFLWVRSLGGRSGANEDAHEVRKVDETHDPAAALVATILVQACALFLAAIRWNAEGDAVSTAWQALVVVVTVLGVRLAVMAMTARAVGLPVRYRPWETGLLLSLALGLVGWGPFPVPGSWYPRRATWSAREELPRLGPIAYLGALGVLITGWLLHVVVYARASTMTPLVAGAVTMGLGYTRILLLFEVLVPVFPFTCYNGRRVLDWRRSSWAVLALGTVLLWVAAFIF